MLKTFFLDLSLNKKLILMMLLMTAVLLVTLITIYWQAEKSLMAQIESQTAELAQAVQVGVEEVTGGASSETRLEKYLSSLKTKGIKEISIISNADEIIASTNPNKVGTPVSQKKKELIIKAELGEPAVDQEGKAYNVIIPVIAGQAHYGYIHLQINVENLQETLRRNTTKRILAALAVFAVGILLSTFLSVWYTEPIHNVVAAARKVAAGDLNQSLPVDRKDEIGDLTQSFNFMVQRLREHKRVEERLREAEHLSAIGQLSRGIAHEIRNPLNFISLSIDHIKSKYRPADGAAAEGFEKLVDSMKEEIHRLDRLVRDFLDYGKPLKLDLQTCPMGELLADVVEIVKAKAESDRIQIVEKYYALPQLKLDTELMKSCLFNVVTNAFQAMPDGGTLTLATEERDGRFLIRIADTGTGVPKADLDRIFEPFFTTKSQGLGLGLAMTKRVIEEHGGKIEFTSVEGRGSEVTISLPLALAGEEPRSDAVPGEEQTWRSS
ncbi:MAG: HAMP domain-containing protein [Syntrophaceae bacterium]|nr:HAMP domain-containing protein [Syntrophaceae bacterium]